MTSITVAIIWAETSLRVLHSGCQRAMPWTSCPSLEREKNNRLRRAHGLGPGVEAEATVAVQRAMPWTSCKSVERETNSRLRGGTRVDGIGQGSRQRQQWQASGKCNGGLSSHWGGRRTIASSDEPTGTASGQGSRQRQQWQAGGKRNGGLSSPWGERRTIASIDEPTGTASG